jgi:hypothetical protein
VQGDHIRKLPGESGKIAELVSGSGALARQHKHEWHDRLGTALGASLRRSDLSREEGFVPPRFEWGY